jgi:transcriptional regulator with XRE-family HTH domain
MRAEVLRRGLSQHKMAKLIGKSQTAAWRRMTGKTAFTLDELQVLAEHFKIPLKRLISDVERAA